MKFVDQVRIHAKAGDGGNGCCSFRREKYIPRGGPNGGDGGHGGDIILEADANTGSLVNLFYEPLLRAKRGAHGQGSNKVGRSARALVVKVPIGTIVYQLPEKEEFVPDQENDEGHPQKKHIDVRKLDAVHDLAQAGQQVVLCKGGQGGKGNTHFKTSTNRAPRKTTEGQPGEEGWFLLELHSIAFAGLVGYPNAGKSTLLRAISAARPKVAAYPFTTLTPHIGIVQVGEYDRVTVADIPGLIEGAHENKGLGYDFLRHVLRCHHLLFVVDMAGSEARDPVSDLQSLREEISLYDPLLARKPWSIVANKMDLPDAQTNLEIVRSRFDRVRILPISASTGKGTTELKSYLLELNSEE